MKLEKRSDGTADNTPAPSPASGEKKKPVIVYIMILFIVAFLLMAFSFFTHQRSNEQVLGTLQSSVSTLQDLQKSQDEIVRLQDELDAANQQIKDLETHLIEQGAVQADADAAVDALLSLHILQQQYAAADYDGCKQTIQAMEDRGASDFLPQEDAGGVISPAQRYQQLKEAVMSH